MFSFEYLKAENLKEALEMVREEGVCPIAGGTKLLVDIRAGEVQPQAVLDIGRLPELRELTHQNGFIELGSCLTMSEVADSPLIKSNAPMLAQAALSIGGPQIRNRATLGGNIISTSPAADTVVSLIALAAEVTLQSASGERKMLLKNFMQGPGLTQVKKDELITKISFKTPGPNERGIFFKFGRRNALAISVVNLAIMGTLDKRARRWGSVRIALGSVAPTVIHARRAESLISSQVVEKQLIKKAVKEEAAECSPISDIRASTDYRRAMVEVLAERLLTDLAGDS